MLTNEALKSSKKGIKAIEKCLPNIPESGSNTTVGTLPRMYLVLKITSHLNSGTVSFFDTF